MHLPSFLRDRSFYAKFYSRHPSEIEIIDKTQPSSSALRTLSQSPTTIIPILFDVTSSHTSGFFSSSDCSSSESTSSHTRRRRTTAPTIQERLNTYESACIRPNPPLPSSPSSKQTTPSIPNLSSPTLVNPINSQQTKNPMNLTNNDPSKSITPVQDNSSSSSSSSLSPSYSIVKNKTISLDSSKRYLSKSTSQLCDQSLNHIKDDQGSSSSSSRNILDVIQEELSEIRRADHDLKKMFLSIYGKIQNIQQIKSNPVYPQKGQRYHYLRSERPSRLITHCCYSSNSDIRRSSCTHLNRKYALHSAVVLRNRMSNSRVTSTADNDSYVDTDSLSSSSDSGTCNSSVDNVPCGDA
ncbi:unnamed protein product [Adineta ricciae]|uniref:Uncharacterized protein n=2 Tax=Adineta ricciae TaxID=249248 RepID=A0A814NAU7_ADIRI|nr:unnamed protein product [Adineta ricciae]